MLLFTIRERKTRNIVIVFLYSIVVWIRPIVNGKKPLQFHRDLIPFPFSIMELHNKVKVWESCFSVLPTLRILISVWDDNSIFSHMHVVRTYSNVGNTAHFCPLLVVALLFEILEPKGHPNSRIKFVRILNIAQCHSHSVFKKRIMEIVLL